MKAVVVEIKNNHAAVLSDDGCIRTIKNNSYKIGQVIQLKKHIINTKRLVTFVSAAAAFIVLGIGSWAYATPYTYVSMDVNPSIEYTLNRFDRVLTVKAINDDGETILREVSLKSLKHKTIQDAIANTIKQITEDGYFDGSTEPGIVITASSENEEKADELANDLKTSVEEETSESIDEINIEVYSVGLERVKEARELGVTPGKLNLVEKLQAAAPASDDTVLEDWLNKPVKEIMKTTKEYRQTATVSGSAIRLETKEATSNQGIDNKLQVQEAIKSEAPLSKKQEKNSLKEEKQSVKEEKSLLKKEEASQVKQQSEVSQPAVQNETSEGPKKAIKSKDKNIKAVTKAKEQTKESDALQNDAISVDQSNINTDQSSTPEEKTDTVSDTGIKDKKADSYDIALKKEEVRPSAKIPKTEAMQEGYPSDAVAENNKNNPGQIKSSAAQKNSSSKKK